MTNKEVMQMALDVLTNKRYAPSIKETTEALRTALAQPEPEPVAVWELQEGGWDTIADAAWMETLPIGTKLYTAPPQRKPLSDEAIYAIGKELGLKCLLGGNPNIDIDFARAIEAAHGIKD